MDPSDLYGLPLERFVPERAALVKALRGAGQRDEAARVAKLGKPSVAAWVVNQLVRTQRPEVQRLFEAGDALKQAQRDVVAGRGGRDVLREASAAEREAIAALVAAARGLLDAQGHSPSDATLARVSATLDAAAVQDDARAQVKDGCLTRELEHIGLGDALAFSAPAAGASRRAAPKPADAARAQDGEADREQAREEQARRREEQARRRKEAEQARRELERAQSRRDRAARDLEDARARLDAATQALYEAESALAQAAERAQQALNAVQS
jgi:hypothetical protein